MEFLHKANEATLHYVLGSLVHFHSSCVTSEKSPLLQVRLLA